MALVPFGSVDPAALRWLRTRDTPAAFSLSAGESEVATLAWDRRGGSLATATWAGGSWTFKRAGFLQPTVLVRQPGTAEPVARLTARLNRAELRHDIVVGTGPTFHLQHVSHVLPSWRLTTAEGSEVLHIEPVPEHRALQGGAVVVSSAAGGAATLLLVVLTWYFVVLSWFEDEAIEALAPFEGPDPALARGKDA